MGEPAEAPAAERANASHCLVASRSVSFTKSSLFCHGIFMTNGWAGQPGSRHSRGCGGVFRQKARPWATRMACKNGPTHHWRARS